MQYTYPCLLTLEDEGGFSVSFPDVPAALTCGDNRAEALEMAKDALAVALGAYMDNREDLPLSSVPWPGQEMVAVRPIVAAKLALYRTMRNQNVTTEAWPNGSARANRACGSYSTPITVLPSTQWMLPCVPLGATWSSKTEPPERTTFSGRS